MRSKQSKALVRTRYKDIKDAIDYHWNTFPGDFRPFIFEKPGEMSLGKLIDFWSRPQKIDSTQGNLAATLCGSSWYLALNYLCIGHTAEAKSLILNGSFLHQCHNSSIEKIKELLQEMIELRQEDNTVPCEVVEEKLPFFYEGLCSTSSRSSMEKYLKDVMPLDYRKIMSFAVQSSMGSMSSYVDNISHDWNGLASSQHKDKHNSSIQAEEKEASIEIVILDVEMNIRSQIKTSLSSELRSIFNQYSEERGISLKSFRFSFRGSILFLSTVGRKTPAELSMKNLDVINVSIVSNTPKQRPSSWKVCKRDDSKKSNLKSKQKRRNKGKNKLRHRSELTGETLEEYKIHHSKKLSCIFEEAGPVFKKIRQRLNDLSIEKTQRKQKKSQMKPLNNISISNNPFEEGLGGKAGKSSFLIHVGQAENLYKTSKPSYLRIRGSQIAQVLSIDLHGLTREVALEKLDNSLPDWIDMAMKGSYPWVKPVLIVCGGGNQILSESVDKWIRRTESVSKAPKSMFS